MIISSAPSTSGGKAIGANVELHYQRLGNQPREYNVWLRTIYADGTVVDSYESTLKAAKETFAVLTEAPGASARRMQSLYDNGV